MPSSSGSIRAGRAFVELFADDSKLVRGLNRASARLKAFGETIRNMGLKLAALGTAAITPLLASTKVFSQMGDDLAKMSARTGFSVETLSELGFAADMSGVSMEDLEAAIRKMQRTLVEAAGGSASARDALAAIGLAVADLDKLSPQQRFKLIADRLAGIEDPTLKAAAAMEVFGRSGTELLPLFAGGAAGIEELQQQARRLGLTISTEDAKAAEEFGDAFAVLCKVLKQGVFIVGSALAPALKDLAERATRAVAVAGQWLRQNRELVVTVLKVAAAVVAGGWALVALGFAVQKLSVVFTIASTALKAFGAVLGFLLSPMGMVIAGAAALGGYLLYVSGAGGKAADWLGQKFISLKDEAVAAFGGISDALAAGDIGQAARIVWLTLKMWWTKGVSWISGIWQDALLWCKVKFAETWGGMRIIFAAVGHGLIVAWIETTAFLSKTWTEFCGWVLKAWAWAGLQLTKLWNNVKAIFSDFDAEAANKAAQQAYEAKKQEIESERDAKLKAREDQRARERTDETREYNESLGRIVDETEARKRAFQTEHDQRIRQSEEELDRARKEWQDSLKAAKDARKAKEDAGPGTLQGPEALLDKFKGLAGNLGAMAAKVGVAGTFNAATLLGLQAGGMEDRIAAAAERTAKGVEGLRQDVRNNKAAFG